MNDACKQSHGPYFNVSRQTVKAVVGVIRSRAADGSGDWNYNLQEGKQSEVEAIKAVILQIGTATGPTAMTKTACMAIVMTTPVMRAPHQINKVALNDVWKRRVKNK